MTTTTAQTCNWPGKSGTAYTYYVYPIGTKFLEQPGNYVFCKKDAVRTWIPQHIGQTKNLNQRLGDHEKEACAKRNGATHIHARLNPTEVARLAEEKDLILNFNPPCNTRHVI